MLTLPIWVCTDVQDSYLSADYERKVFNVSACTWVEGAEENIVTITSKDQDSTDSTGGGTTDSGDPSDSGHSSLSGGSIAGIVVGVVLLVLLIAAAAFIIIRRRKKRAYSASEPEVDESILKGPVHNSAPRSSVGGTPAKSVGERLAEEHGLELDGHDTHVRPTTELDAISQQIARPPTPVYYELAASDVGTAETDGVSTVGTLPSREARDEEHSPPSPYVSTLGTEGWQGDIGDGSPHMVSPTTPIRRDGRSQIP